MASETQVERWFREFGPTPLEETMFSASHRENLSSKIRGDYDNIFIVWPETNPGASSLTVGLSHEPFVAHVNNDPESVVKEYVEYNDLLERNSSWCIHCNLMRLNIPDEVKAASRRFLRSEDADGWNNAGGDDGEAGWERPKSL